MYRQYVSSKVMPVKITHLKYNIARVFFFFFFFKRDNSYLIIQEENIYGWFLVNCVCLRHKDLHLIKVLVKSLQTLQANLQCAETFTQNSTKERNL